MKNPFTLLALLIGAGLLYNALPLVGQVYGRYRSRRLVTCPETEALAEVELYAGLATATSIAGKPMLRARSCTLWPGKRDCTQECVQENWM